jgi:hypothetical protein
VPGPAALTLFGTEVAMNIYEFLERAQAELGMIGERTYLTIERTLVWKMNGTGSVSGGTFLVDKALGQLAEVEIERGDGQDIVTKIEPLPKITVAQARALDRALDSTYSVD